KKGDYPPSHLAQLKPPVKAPNDINEGSEALICALDGKDYPEGTPVTERNLVNTDDDSSPNWTSRDGSSMLLEAKDGWGNPIAYICFRDYGRQFTIRMTPETAEPDQADQIVEAR